MITKKARLLLLTLFAVSIVGLAYLCILGYYVRPGADDLYYTSFDGSAPHYIFHFLNGRVTSILLYGVFYQVPHFLQIVPTTSILLLLVGMFVFLRAIIRPYITTSRLTLVAMSLAAFLSFAVCMLLPGLYVSMYWFAAAPVHTWSISLSLLYLGAAIEFCRKIDLRVILFFLGAIVVGCLAEIAAMSIFLIAVGVLIASFIRKEKNSLKVGLGLLVSSLISLGILFFSPGAVNRRNYVSTSSESSITDAIVQLPAALWNNLTTIPSLLDNWLILFIVPAVVALLFTLVGFSKKISLKSAWCFVALCWGIALLYIMMNGAVIWIGLHEPQPLRSHFSTTLMLVLASASLGIPASIYANIARGSSLIRNLVISISILATSSILLLLPSLAEFSSNIIQRSRGWDQRTTLINNAVRNSNCKIPIPALPIKGMWVESANPNYWVNDSLASYYKLPCHPYTQEQYLDKYIPLG